VNTFPKLLLLYIGMKTIGRIYLSIYNNQYVEYPHLPAINRRFLVSSNMS